MKEKKTAEELRNEIVSYADPNGEFIRATLTAGIRGSWDVFLTGSCIPPQVAERARAKHLDLLQRYQMTSLAPSPLPR